MPRIFIDNASGRYCELVEAVLGESRDCLAITHAHVLDKAKANAALAKRYRGDVVDARWQGVAIAILVVLFAASLDVVFHWL